MRSVIDGSCVSSVGMYSIENRQQCCCIMLSGKLNAVTRYARFAPDKSLESVLWQSVHRKRQYGDSTAWAGGEYNKPIQ